MPAFIFLISYYFMPEAAPAAFHLSPAVAEALDDCAAADFADAVVAAVFVPAVLVVLAVLVVVVDADLVDWVVEVSVPDLADPAAVSAAVEVC